MFILIPFQEFVMVFFFKQSIIKHPVNANIKLVLIVTGTVTDVPQTFPILKWVPFLIPGWL